MLIACCITRRKLLPDSWGTTLQYYNVRTGSNSLPKGSAIPTITGLARVVISSYLGIFQFYMDCIDNNYYPTVQAPPYDTTYSRYSILTVCMGNNHYPTVQVPPSNTTGLARVIITTWWFRHHPPIVNTTGLGRVTITTWWFRHHPPIGNTTDLARVTYLYLGFPQFYSVKRFARVTICYPMVQALHALVTIATGRFRHLPPIVQGLHG